MSNDDYFYLKRLHETSKRQKEETYKDNSKKRLLNNLEKKFQTTIIGSLAVFEEKFGHLWGHGLPLNNLDDEQRYWRSIWLDARSKILDNGNTNLRAAQSEISQYTMTWDRYITELTVLPPGNKGD